MVGVDVSIDMFKEDVSNGSTMCYKLSLKIMIVIILLILVDKNDKYNMCLFVACQIPLAFLQTQNIGGTNKSLSLKVRNVYTSYDF